jgi:acetyl esterase
MATVMSRYEVDVEDVEYVRHGGKPYLARVYKPRGPGPFPFMINLHGGAWTKKDRTSDVGMNEALAKSGVVVASLDFRMPPDAGYPASMQDVNYAIRWFKSRAKEYKTTPGNIGIVGTSSGGHQAMLTAMRPTDARYAALAVDGKSGGDATVRAVVLCWPVIDPLGRYQHAAKLKAEGNPKLFDSVAQSHDQYWQNEAAMEEGNPTRALERGEKSPLPPVLYVQGTVDAAHPRPQLDRFVAAYRKAGGKLDLQFYEGVGEAFITNDPKSPQAIAAIDKIIEFVHREMR